MRSWFQRAVIPFTILLAIVISYNGLSQTFFQQDEWQYFGSSIFALKSSNTFTNIILPLQGQVTHFFPLATLFFLLEYMMFKINFSPYSIVNLIFHSFNALLIYILSWRLMQRRVIAWGTALLFAVNSLAHQPITWVAAGMGTLPGTSFLLIFFFGFLKYLQSKKNIVLAGSVATLIVAILFKETFLFVFVLLFGMWFAEKFILKRSLQVPKIATIVLTIVGVSYFFLRVLFLLSPIRSAQPEIGDVSAAPLLVYLYRLMVSPLKAWPQSLFPFPFLRRIADAAVHNAYPYFLAADGVADPLITESIVFDLVTIVLSVNLFLVSLFVYGFLRRKEPRLSRIFVFSILFTFTSVIPFVFIPGRAGYFSIFEPRNLYTISIGSSSFLAIVLYALIKKIAPPHLSALAMTIGFVIMGSFHGILIQKDIVKLQEIGSIRKNLLITIERDYSRLPSSVIMYAQSDRSYYGLPEFEKILPVQSGFGRMLMVWYQDKEKFPACLYEQQFLHNLTAQGYRECEGRGFGFFWNYDSLREAIRTNKLQPDIVIAYVWRDKGHLFTNITEEIRSKIKQDVR